MGTRRNGTPVGRRMMLRGAAAGLGAAWWAARGGGTAQAAATGAGRTGSGRGSLTGIGQSDLAGDGRGGLIASGRDGLATSGQGDLAAHDRLTARGHIAVRRIGPFEVLALLDAHGPFPGRRQDHFTGADPAAWERARRIDPAAFGPDDTWELDFRCYAIRRPGGRVTLVDTGVGPAGSPAGAWAPVPGELPRVLACAGIEAADVDTVVLTHLHEDHYGWAVSPTGTPMFPDARHLVQHAEIAALTEADTAMTYVVEPLRRAGLLQPIDGRRRILRRGKGGVVTAVPTPGHTPGHQSVLVDGGRERIVVTGDVLVHAVQLADPDVSYRFEQDEETARQTRRRLLAASRRRHAVLATAHLNRPFVRVR